MDNFKFTFVGIHSKDLLRQALALAFTKGDGRLKASSAEGYLIHPEKGLVFLGYIDRHSKDPAVVEFPFKMDAEGCADWAYRWLENAEYGPEPDHDGSNSKGFKVYNDSWSRVDSYYGSLVAVKPEWCWHGK